MEASPGFDSAEYLVHSRGGGLSMRPCAPLAGSPPGAWSRWAEVCAQPASVPLNPQNDATSQEKSKPLKQ